MRLNRLTQTVACALTPLLSFPLAAQQLPAVTVIGVVPVSQSTPLEAGFGVTKNVVSTQAIENQNSMDFNDTLKNVPGVMTTTTTMVGGQTGASLFIRGRGASHPSPDLLVQFDGVPRMGALYGQTLGDGIAVNTIRDVEVFTSPAPAYFGSGYALVNVKPQYMDHEGRFAEVTLAGGSHKSFSEALSAGVKQGAFDFYAAQSWLSTDGHRDHSRANQQNYYVNMGLALNDHWEARFLMNQVTGQTQQPANKNKAVERTTALPRYDTESTFTTFSVNHEFERAHGYVKLYWNDTTFDIKNEDLGKADSEQKIRLYGLRTRETLFPTDATEFMFGFDLDRQVLDNAQTTKASGEVKTWDFPAVTVFSPYAAVSHLLGDEEAWYVKPSAGLRWFHNNTFGHKTAPQAGVTLGYSNTSLSFDYARGVNYPSPVVFQGLLNGSGWNKVKTEDVKPEVVDHYEIKLAHDWADVASTSIAFFEDRGKDRFRAFMGPQFGLISQANDRIGRYKITGVEVAATVEPMDALEVFGSATWMKVRATGADNKTATHMPYTPKLMVKAGVDWTFMSRTRLYADIQHMMDVYEGTTKRAGLNDTPFAYSDGQKLKDITIVNARLSRTFDYAPWSIKDAEAFIAVDNLLDHQYSYQDGYPMPGMTWMIGTTIRFE